MGNSIVRELIQSGYEVDSIGGAKFFLAHEAPAYGTRGPSVVGFTTVRIELFVDDPIAVQRRALAAGAREHSPVTEEQFAMTGPEPIKRILPGSDCRSVRTHMADWKDNGIERRIAGFRVDFLTQLRVSSSRHLSRSSNSRG